MNDIQYDIESNTVENTKDDVTITRKGSNLMKKVVAGTVLTVILIATIVSIFAFRSDEDSKSQLEIDNQRTKEMYESLMKSDNKILDERFFDENITNFLSETLDEEKIEFENTANMELDRGNERTMIRVHGHVPCLYGENIGGEGTMIMFSQNSRFEILMELKSTSIANVSNLIGGSSNQTYPELQFVQGTPVTLLLSTIETIDVAQFNLGESCDGQTEQRRGLSVCGSLEATRNVTDIEDVAYTFTGSTMHQSTLVGSIRPVVQLESSSQHWNEITLSDQVWVTDVKIHFGHTESWLEAVVHVRLDQEDDQLEIPVNVTEESNHLYQLQADGHISKTWHLPNGQTLSVREIDLRLTYDKNRTNDQVYGEIDANVTLGHNVQMDLSLNLPMSVFQLVGHVRSTFSLNDLDGNTATEIQFTENAVVMFDHYGCRINATLDLDNLDPTLYNTIEDFHLSNNTREFIKISGSFDTHLRTFDFEASLRDFSLSSSLYFDFVKLHISSSVKRRFYLSCKANVLLHDGSPLAFDVSTTVQGDGIIHFKGNTSQVWNDASVFVMRFSGSKLKPLNLLICLILRKSKSAEVQNVSKCMILVMSKLWVSYSVMTLIERSK